MSNLITQQAELPRVIERRVVHRGWNELCMIRVQSAAGTDICRSVENHGDVAVLLPFDARRRTTLLVRQLRVPLLDAHQITSTLEAPAGVVEETEPSDTAQREALEEAGVWVRSPVKVGTMYAMPSVSTERLHLYVGEYCESDRVSAGGGLDDEQEEIEVVEVKLSEASELVDSGEISDMKTVLLIWALRHQRPDLFDCELAQ